MLGAYLSLSSLVNHLFKYSLYFLLSCLVSLNFVIIYIIYVTTYMSVYIYVDIHIYMSIHTLL